MSKCNGTNGYLKCRAVNSQMGTRSILVLLPTDILHLCRRMTALWHIFLSMSRIRGTYTGT